MDSKQERNNSLSTNILFFIFYFDCFINFHSNYLHNAQLFSLKDFMSLKFCMKFHNGFINSNKGNKSEIKLEILLYEECDIH